MYSPEDILKCECGRTVLRVHVGQTHCTVCQREGRKPAKAKPNVVEIEIPTSVWKLYAGWGSNRRLSPEYKEWRKKAVQAMAENIEAFGEGPVRVKILYRVSKSGFSNARDGDNGTKAVLDALVEAGIVTDDRWRIVRGHSIDFVEKPGNGASVLVAVSRYR